MKIGNSYNLYMNKIIKIISPITYQSYKVEISGNEVELKELLGEILEIDPHSIKGLRDSFNNHYTISNALQNPLLNNNPNNYYTVVLKENKNYIFQDEDDNYHQKNTAQYKIKDFMKLSNELNKRDYLNNYSKKKLDKLIIANNSEVISIFKYHLNSQKSYEQIAKKLKLVIDSNYHNFENEKESSHNSSNESSHSKHKKNHKHKQKSHIYDKNKNNNDNSSNLKNINLTKRISNNTSKNKKRVSINHMYFTLKNKIFSLLEKGRKDLFYIAKYDLEKMEKNKKESLLKMKLNLYLGNNEEIQPTNLTLYYTSYLYDNIFKDFDKYEKSIYDSLYEKEETKINELYESLLIHQDLDKFLLQIKNKIKEEENKEAVHIAVEVNEIYSKTEVTQNFINVLDKSIELSIIFPINKKINLIKFEVSIDDTTIISKILPKDKAEEKYNDAIASGDVGFISRYNNDCNSYSVNIGNIKPKQQVKLKSFFIEIVSSKDLSFAFNIMENYPVFYYQTFDKDSINKIINAIITIKTQSKITRLISPVLFKLEEKNYIYKINYSEDYKKAEIIYKNYNSDFNYDGQNEDNNNLSILFRTENINKPLLCSQYNPLLDEISYSINYTYISKSLKEIPIPEKPDEDNNICYTVKYEENIINEMPGLFIFLIDQSGSMYGTPIELVKKSLLLFIQSLPKKSYFQLIGFGTVYKKYNEKPVKYTNKNVKIIKDIIKDLNADLGGTNIYEPLKNIYNVEEYSKINLSKNIFLITDGKVSKREDCLELIENNSGKFRIHSIGIGFNFDKIFIERSGKLGKGSSSFVSSLEKINSEVINALNRALRPYLTNIKFEFENYEEEIASNIITCNSIDNSNNFIYQNEVINYSFILPGNKELTNLKIKISGKDPINFVEDIFCFDNILKLENGEELSKMIVSRALKINDELLNDEIKEVNFAKKYQILSKNTAFFAKILNKENQNTELIKVNLFNSNKNYSPRYDKKLFCLNKISKACQKKCCMERRHKTVTSIDLFSLLKKNKSKERSNDNKEINIIMSQDIIEGFWDENNETKKLIDIIGLYKFDKIKDKVNSLNKGENKSKIIYTLLVIYYLKTKCVKNSNEYKLIINKANKYLEKNGIDYDNIIDNI